MIDFGEMLNVILCLDPICQMARYFYTLYDINQGE